ncbi:MAG: hypothetical protein R3249_06505, partial [Nitriliruptorales bacterium]|nr:hypothetical protein [Nitriliruptorales bacterium]
LQAWGVRTDIDEVRWLAAASVLARGDGPAAVEAFLGERQARVRAATELVAAVDRTRPTRLDAVAVAVRAVRDALMG